MKKTILSTSLAFALVLPAFVSAQTLTYPTPTQGYGQPSLDSNLNSGSSGTYDPTGGFTSGGSMYYNTVTPTTGGNTGGGSVITTGGNTGSGVAPTTGGNTGAGNTPTTGGNTGSGNNPTTGGNTGSGISTISNPLAKKFNSVGAIVQGFVDIFTYIVIIIAVLALVWVGLQVILAQGKPDRLSELKGWLLYIVIGIAIVVGARVIINVVINTLEASGTVNSSVIQNAKKAANGQ